MPKTITQEWKSQLGTNPEEVHLRLVDTFGNLTLTGYNSELGRMQFKDKKEKLNNTHIELNRWILTRENWGESEITDRAETLLSKAKQLWAGPVSVS